MQFHVKKNLIYLISRLFWPGFLKIFRTVVYQYLAKSCAINPKELRNYSKYAHYYLATNEKSTYTLAKLYFSRFIVNNITFVFTKNISNSSSSRLAVTTPLNFPLGMVTQTLFR